MKHATVDFIDNSQKSKCYEKNRESDFKSAVLAVDTVLIAYAVMIIQKSYLTWAIVMAIASVAVFVIASVYFCIRQKCYQQLAITLFVLLIWGLVFLSNHAISSI